MKIIKIKCEITLLQEDADAYWDTCDDLILGDFVLDHIPGHAHGEFEVIKKEAPDEH